MIHGRWYGLGLDRAPGWRVAISQETPEKDLLLGEVVVEEGVMEVVSRACEIARLLWRGVLVRPFRRGGLEKNEKGVPR